MYKVYKDKELRERLIKKGLERGKEFSWEKPVREIINVLKNVN